MWRWNESLLSGSYCLAWCSSGGRLYFFQGEEHSKAEPRAVAQTRLGLVLRGRQSTEHEMWRSFHFSKSHGWKCKHCVRFVRGTMNCFLQGTKDEWRDFPLVLVVWRKEKKCETSTTGFTRFYQAVTTSRAPSIYVNLHFLETCVPIYYPRELNGRPGVPRKCRAKNKLIREIWRKLDGEDLKYQQICHQHVSSRMNEVSVGHLNIICE